MVRVAPAPSFNPGSYVLVVEVASQAVHAPVPLAFAERQVVRGGIGLAGDADLALGRGVVVLFVVQVYADFDAVARGRRAFALLTVLTGLSFLALSLGRSGGLAEQLHVFRLLPFPAGGKTGWERLPPPFHFPRPARTHFHSPCHTSPPHTHTRHLCPRVRLSPSSNDSLNRGESGVRHSRLRRCEFRRGMFKLAGLGLRRSAELLVSSARGAGPLML